MTCIPYLPPDTTEAPGATPDAERPLRAAAVRGNHEAFGDLYRQSRDVIHRYLVRRLNGDRHLAEDLTHETFTRALARIDTYQEMGRPFVAWLLTIAGNLVVDYYKSAWRRLQVPCGDLGFDVDADRNSTIWGDGSGEVDATVVAEQHRRYVRSVLLTAIGELTDWQQQVVRLRYLEGLSVRDTAIKLDTQEGAVKAATYRAVRVLARDPRLDALKTDLLG